MKNTLKNSWWKVPLYCMVAGWLSFQIEVHIGPRFLMTKLPNGTVAVHDTHWMIMSLVILLGALAIGGFLFFRRMSKQEILCSASVMVAFNVIAGLIAHFFQRLTPHFTIFLAKINAWIGFVDQVLYDIGLNPWIVALVGWSAPYLFVIFGNLEDEYKKSKID